MPRLEIWGGPECTIARIGDRRRDQAEETGHRARADDIDRIAELGIRTVRYPILWERVAPERPDKLDFTWPDERLARLEALGIGPIAGLLHHGSGPAYTELLDPDFQTKFADYAGAVACRYQDIHRWTPVKEPLTTARCCGRSSERSRPMSARLSLAGGPAARGRVTGSQAYSAAWLTMSKARATRRESSRRNAASAWPTTWSIL